MLRFMSILFMLVEDMIVGSLNYHRTRARRMENNGNGVSSWHHTGLFSSNCAGGTKHNWQLQFFCSSHNHSWLHLSKA